MHHLRLTSKQVLHVKRIRPPLFVTIIFAFLTVLFLPIHTNAQPRKPYVAGLSVGLGYSLSPGYSSFLRDAYPDVKFILTGMTPLDLSMPLSLIDLFKGKKVNLYIIPRARFYLGRVDIFTKGFGSTERGNYEYDAWWSCANEFSDEYNKRVSGSRDVQFIYIVHVE